MEDSFAHVKKMATHIKEYVSTRIASVKLNAAEKSSKTIAGIISVAVVLLAFVFFIIFASIAAAYIFAKLTGEMYWGFLIVAGIYLLIGLLLWLMREKMLRLPVTNAILRQLFKEDNEADEED